MANKRTLVLWLLLFAATLLVVPSVPAQEKAADNMQFVLEKIRADKKLLIADNMQLTEPEAKSFWPIYERYQDELFLIRARTIKLITDYKDSYDKMTNPIAKKLLDEYMTIESLRWKLNQAYLPKFRKILPDIKVARYYQLENKIQVALMYEIVKETPLAKAK